MIASRNNELIAKLVAIGAMLASLGMTSPALTAAYKPQTEGWEASSPAMVKRPETALHTIEIARSEVRATGEILSLVELKEDAAFWSYVSTIDAALSTYHQSPKQEVHLRGLAGSLALARAALEGEVKSLTRWQAVVRATQPNADRYVRPPVRFVSVASLDLVPVPTVSSTDVETWLVAEQASIS